MWKARLSLVRDTTSGTEVPAVSTSVVREMSVKFRCSATACRSATCFLPVVCTGVTRRRYKRVMSTLSTSSQF